MGNRLSVCRPPKPTISAKRYKALKKNLEEQFAYLQTIDELTKLLDKNKDKSEVTKNSAVPGIDSDNRNTSQEPMEEKSC
uniref:BHLH domain-containing protein n=1 Tax=Caenorhabditis tropicalis TaxID=1561998 RepID=A0A1I7UPU5_9PELO